jgi:hypothetical protein
MGLLRPGQQTRFARSRSLTQGGFQAFLRKPLAQPTDGTCAQAGLLSDDFVLVSIVDGK